MNWDFGDGVFFRYLFSVARGAQTDAIRLGVYLESVLVYPSTVLRVSALESGLGAEWVNAHVCGLCIRYCAQIQHNTSESCPVWPPWLYEPVGPEPLQTLRGGGRLG